MGIRPEDLARAGLTVRVAEAMAAAPKGTPPKYPEDGKKRNKFNVSKKSDRTLDGVTFDSKLEMNVWKCLRDHGFTPEVQIPFELQPKFELDGVKYRAITYVADFALEINGRRYILDAKGFSTPDYKMKLKLMAYVHKVSIVEIKSVKAMREFIEKAKKGFVTAQKILAPQT